jgi:Putative restriction endonuclease
MSTAPDLYGRGPYTVEDLDALPEEGKRFELVHGWLIPMSPSVRHDESAEMLKEIIADAVRVSGADHKKPFPRERVPLEQGPPTSTSPVLPRPDARSDGRGSGARA